MTFKHFDRPEIFTGLMENETTCDGCAEQKFCFEGELFYGEAELSAICPECLAGGYLMELDAFTCEGDIAELKRQLKKINPALSKQEITELAKQKTLELEKRTPHLITWQDWSWPCIDGDYCQFIGYGSRTFYDAFAKNTSGKAVFKDSLHYSIKDDADDDELWDDVPKQPIKDYNESSEYSTVFYVFKSLNSDKIITIWDRE